jgi:hypothetical protein
MPVKITEILRKWPFKVIFGVFGIILVLSAVFFCRKPVILVTDSAFNVLYGKERAQTKALLLSLSLFRPIKTIVIAEGAGPDLVVQGATSLSRRPFAVFFPYRYGKAARRYAEGKPDIPVVVLAGREGPQSSAGGNSLPESLLWVNTDTVTDLYRVGLFAGVFARYDSQKREETGEGLNGSEEIIALFHERPNNEEKTAFLRGLREQKWGGSPLFSQIPAETVLVSAVICNDSAILEEENARSLIIFTWMDPALAPRKTLAVFDDAPWTQIGPALAFLKKGVQNGMVPSDIIICGRDKAQKIVYNELKEIKTLKKRTENADN